MLTVTYAPKHFVPSEPLAIDVSKGKLDSQNDRAEFGWNSKFGKIYLPPKFDEPYFYKITPRWKDEIENATVLAAYYPHIHRPLYFDSDAEAVVFPYVEGVSVREKRLAYERHRSSDDRALLISIEKLHAEHTLNAWKASARIGHHNGVPSASNRYFFDRLVGNQRLREFYPMGIELSPRINASLDEFLHFRFIINGKDYGKLDDRLRFAEDCLRGEVLDSSLSIVGRGDCHCGNVLICEEKSDGSLLHDKFDMRYVDYETAGRHAAMKDLSKLFYVDVFFAPFFESFLTDGERKAPSFTLEYAQRPGELRVACEFRLSKLSRDIYEIRKKYFLRPLLEYCRDSGFFDFINATTEPWYRALGAALLCNAILSLKFDTRYFLANLAIGVMLTEIGDPIADQSFMALGDAVGKCFCFE